MNEEKNDEKIPVIYCNGIQIASSPYDFTFLINQNTPSTSQSKAEIIMSPEHAKVFCQLLLHNINEYEDTFGQIPNTGPEMMNKLVQEGKLTVEREPV